MNFVCEDDRKFAIIDGLKTKIARRYQDISAMDRLRVDFSDGWILFRASNTEPKIRLTIEADTPERFEALKREFAALMQNELTTIYRPSFLAKLKALFGKKH